MRRPSQHPRITGMPLRLDTRAADFAREFRILLDTKRETAADVVETVRGIIADVIARGDRALVELTNRFDRFDLDVAGIRLSANEIAAATDACDRETLSALEFARERIESYHRRQLPH